MATDPTTKVNLTIKLDKALLRQARILAAEQDTSISALVASKLEEAVRQRNDYNQAKQRALAALEKGFDLGGSVPTREEIHERKIVR
jgi:predicted transcriptional regulator